MRDPFLFSKDVEAKAFPLLPTAAVTNVSSPLRYAQSPARQPIAECRRFGGSEKMHYAVSLMSRKSAQGMI